MRGAQEDRAAPRARGATAPPPPPAWCNVGCCLRAPVARWPWREVRAQRPGRLGPGLPRPSDRRGALGVVPGVGSWGGAAPRDRRRAIPDPELRRFRAAAPCPLRTANQAASRYILSNGDLPTRRWTNAVIPSSPPRRGQPNPGRFLPSSRVPAVPRGRRRAQRAQRWMPCGGEPARQRLPRARPVGRARAGRPAAPRGGGRLAAGGGSAVHRVVGQQAARGALQPL